MTNESTASICCAIPLTERTHILMRGSDRASFLHNLCTNEIKRLEPGQGCEAFITDVRGKTIGHVLVFCGESELAIETEPNQSATLMPHFDKYLITEDVELSDQTPNQTDIAVFGEAAEKTLEELGLPTPTANYSHASGELGGISVEVRRVPFTAAACFLLQVPGDNSNAVVQALNDAGASNCTADTFEALRIGFGWPRFDQDFSGENLPQELNRNEVAISFTKGCYLGQETVARIDALGHVNRMLAGLAITGEASVGTPLLVEGKEIGTLTSVARKPGSDDSVGLAIIRAEHTAVGTQLSCGNASAEVVALPG